jgi:hypothetical protein
LHSWRTDIPGIPVVIMVAIYAKALITVTSYAKGAGRIR